MIKSTGLILKPRAYYGSVTPPASLIDTSRFANTTSDYSLIRTRLPSGLWCWIVNGGGGYARYAASSILAPLTSLTVAIWVRRTGAIPASTWPSFFGNGQGGATPVGWLFYHNPTGNSVNWCIGKGSGGGRNMTAGITTLNIWTMFVGTYDNVTSTSYKDGAYVTSDSYTGPLAYGSNRLQIGGIGNSWPGDIALASYYSYALTASAVRRLYDREKNWFGVN